MKLALFLALLAGCLFIFNGNDSNTSVSAFGSCPHPSSSDNHWGQVHVETNYRNKTTGEEGVASGIGVRLTIDHGGDSYGAGQNRTQTTNSNGVTSFCYLKCGWVRYGEFRYTYNVAPSGVPDGLPSGGEWVPSSGGGRLQNNTVYHNSFTYEYETPEATVQVSRIPTGDLTQNDVNDNNVRVRIPAQNYNQLMGSGASVSATVPSDGDSIRVTGSNGKQQEQRIRMRVCSGGSCGGWTGWTGWGFEYADQASSSVPANGRLEAQIEYFQENEPDITLNTCPSLPDPVKVIRFPSRYNQSLSTPGGYASWGSTTTRTRTTETSYISHSDDSPGAGERIDQEKVEY